MFANLKSYSEYKPSGTDWLGDVPAHWKIRPAFGVYTPTLEKNTGLKEETVLSLSYGRIVIKPPEKLHGLVPESFETYQIVSPGDIVLRTTDLQNDHTSLRVGMVRNRGIITSAYLALRTRTNVKPSYGYQLLNVWDLSKAIYRYGSGLRQNLDFTHFKRMLVALPPHDEQSAIVRYIDCVNERIERAIRNKRRQLALVSEMLTTVTQQAMQLQGAKTLRLSTVTEVVLRPVDRQPGQSYTPIGLYNRGRGIFHKAPTDGAHLGDSDFFWVEAGDLVLSGQFAWEGAVALARIRDSGCVASHRYPILRGRKDYVSSPVLLALLRTTYGGMLLNEHSRGAAGRNRPLNISRLLKEKVPVPPMSAQAQITKLVDQEDALSQSLAQSLRFVNEYRTRLITDVVTGKLDIREAASQLPTIEASRVPVKNEEVLEEEELEPITTEE